MSRGGATSSHNGEADISPAGDTSKRPIRGGRDGRPSPQGEAVPVAVTWDDRQRRPVTLVWRQKRYRVERVLEMWVVETGWWKDDGHVSRSYWRVRAGGRVFDLRYDRLARVWALEKVLS